MACLIGFFPSLSFAEKSDQLADIGLERRIAVLQSSAQENAFEIGMLQSLRAVEKTLQTRFDYGLGDSLAELPMLRLEVPGPANPQPLTAQPDTLSNIVRGFVADMRQAQDGLNSVDAETVQPFELTLQDLWFDVNNDGQRAAEESAAAILAPVILGRRAMRDPDTTKLLENPLTIRFDHADYDWLLAYTHLLSGFGNAFLAFDPTPVIRELTHQQAILANAPTIDNVFDIEAINTEISELTAMRNQSQNEEDKHSATRDELRRQRADIEEKLRVSAVESEQQTLKTELLRLNEIIELLNITVQELRSTQRFLHFEIRSAKERLLNDQRSRQRHLFIQQSELDLAYLIIASLRQQPDADHVRAVRKDWQAMIDHNLSFWAKLDLETDNDREWIPNPNQTSVLPLSLPTVTAKAWQRILTDAHDVLDGNLLIQHPFLPDGHGINLAAYFDDPGPLNLLDWFHGIAAYKYAARGPVFTQQSWRAFNRLTNGNAAGFALFLN